MHKRFEGELAVLQGVLADRNAEYRAASFLRSAFKAPVWDMKIGATRMRVDWGVRLPSGALLTSAGQERLLTTLKCWVCLQDHPDTATRVKLASTTLHRRVQRVLHLIDYLLVNADSLSLENYGIELLTENDFQLLIMRLAESSSTAVSIYDWPRKLAAFLRAKLSEVSQTQFDVARSEQPEISSPFLDDDQMLDFDQGELELVRAWLWLNGFYRKASSHLAFDWSVDTVRLAGDIYKGTLLGRLTFKPLPPELMLAPAGLGQTEMPRAPVRSTDAEGKSVEELRPYLATLGHLQLLLRVGLPVPLQALRARDDKALMKELKKLGRFRTLPQSVVFGALKAAIEFGLKFGRPLVEGYLALVRLWIDQGRPLTFWQFANEQDLAQVLPKALLELGVRQWAYPRTRENIEYYPLVRANRLFVDLLRVLCGSVYICTGTLMARRSAELDEVTLYCLDLSKTRLVFFNRKSGFGDMREKTVRPIPPVAVQLIETLQALHEGCRSLGVDTPDLLFCYPAVDDARLVSGTQAMHAALDLFCDYFQLPLNQEGQRYYIRQHQLRRFFAMLFFWGNAFGGMETLRWFLAQTDVEHLYNYITESLSGGALASVKAGYATDRILADSPEVVSLSEILKQRYGTPQFDLMTRDELVEVIAGLVLDDKVTIEPEFFHGPAGKEYRILVLVSERAASETTS